MSTPDPKNPFPKDYMVRLDVRTEGDFLSVSCEMCHKRLVQGDLVSLAANVSEVLRRVVVEHLHEV